MVDNYSSLVSKEQEKRNPWMMPAAKLLYFMLNASSLKKMQVLSMFSLNHRSKPKCKSWQQHHLHCFATFSERTFIKEVNSCWWRYQLVNKFLVYISSQVSVFHINSRSERMPLRSKPTNQVGPNHRLAVSRQICTIIMAKAAPVMSHYIFQSIMNVDNSCWRKYQQVNKCFKGKTNCSLCIKMHSS